MTYRPQTATRSTKSPTGWYYLDPNLPVSDQSAAVLAGAAHRFNRRPIGPYSCRCGCGRHVTNWTQECYPQPWWDTPGLPSRRVSERCANHQNCAYRDDEPYRCPGCHTIPERCTCRRDFGKT
jgi:hypothetical protein